MGLRERASHKCYEKGWRCTPSDTWFHDDGASHLMDFESGDDGQKNVLILFGRMI